MMSGAVCLLGYLNRMDFIITSYFGQPKQGFKNWQCEAEGKIKTNRWGNAEKANVG